MSDSPRGRSRRHAKYDRYAEERTRRGKMFLDATRRSRIETRQRCHKSLYETRKTQRGQDAAARQTKIQIEAVFKAPADHERVCILNEPERCCRRSAMPRGENSATRRPAKRIKKIHEGIAPRRAPLCAAPLSTAQRRDAANRARTTGRKVTYRVVRANRFLFRRR